MSHARRVLGLSQAAQPAREFRIIPSGHFSSTDGRRDGAWTLTDSNAKSIVAKASARTQDYAIDYEHSTTVKGAISPAAGWFKQLSARPDGIYITDARWTDRAAQMILAKEYRFVSPLIEVDGGTGEVVGLINIALTNNPALHGLTDLAAGTQLSAQASGGDGFAGCNMTDLQKEAWMNAFGKTPMALRAIDVAELAARTESSRGFEGSGMTDLQREMWMNAFGRSPAELRRLVP